MPSSTSTEFRPPSSTLATLLVQYTHHHTQDSTRQFIPAQEILDATTNISVGQSDRGWADASEPQTTDALRRSGHWSPSAGQVYVDVETKAKSASPAPFPLIRRQARKTQLPAGAYAEPNSDLESGDEDGAERNNDECVEAQDSADVSQPGCLDDDDSPNQRGQPRCKRRKRASFQENVSNSRALRS